MNTVIIIIAMILTLQILHSYDGSRILSNDAIHYASDANAESFCLFSNGIIKNNQSHSQAHLADRNGEGCSDIYFLVITQSCKQRGLLHSLMLCI